jgi:transposase InsO family protein
MTRAVFNYVNGCDRCQRAKVYPQAPAGKLRPVPLASAPWKDISVDFITGLPLNDGCDAILTVCCRKTKQVHVIPTTTETSSTGLTKLYHNHVWKLHGMPDTIISDRGPQFASNFMKELAALLGIKLKLSTAYHPQTDGQTERMNQELKQYLRLFVNHRQSNWVQ